MRSDKLGRNIVLYSGNVRSSLLLATIIALGAAVPAAGSTFTVSGEADLDFNLPPNQFLLGDYGGSQDTANVPRVTRSAMTHLAPTRAPAASSPMGSRQPTLVQLMHRQTASTNSIISKARPLLRQDREFCGCDRHLGRRGHLGPVDSHQHYDQHQHAPGRQLDFLVDVLWRQQRRLL